MVREVGLLIFTLLSIGCRSDVPPAKSQATTSPTTRTTPTAQIKPYVPDNFGGGFGEEIMLEEKQTFSHLGYTAVIKTRGVPVPHLRAERKVHYAALEKNGKTIATFDGGIELFSEIHFGLVSLLRGEEKQLIVKQKSNKYWRYWIVRLSPKFEVIYDGGNYDAIYPLRTIDADSDGNLEIVQNLGTFWYVPYDNVYSPRPEIIFRYEPRARQFLPANHKFQTLVLGDIEKRLKAIQSIKSQPPDSNQVYLGADVFDVRLRYLYAGKKKEAWEIFERESFPPTNKEEFKKEINQYLKKDAIYKAIYKNQ
jgi:hypothetical protein